MDAVFRLGEVPLELPECLVRKAHFQAAPGKLLVWMDAVARFLVQEGREILVQPLPGAQESDLRELLLCSPMGALLHQRGVLPLHASVIVTEQGAVAFAGRSGHGKSTLAALFQRRGHPVLADDLAVVTFDEAGRPMVAPGYPQLKLRPDSLAQLGHGSAQLPRVRAPREKFAFAFPEAFHAEPLPLVRLYVLEACQSADGLRLETLPVAEKLRHLLTHTYRKGYLAGLGRKPAHFQMVARLVTAVPAKLVKRPAEDGFQLDELAGLLAADFGS
ncbi:MAG: hypothetical protein RL514_1523 [Verrucomicrobiota bacterium]